MPVQIGAVALGSSTPGFNFYQELESEAGTREYSLNAAISSQPARLLVSYGATLLVYGSDRDFVVSGATLTLQWDPVAVHPITVRGVST